MDATLMGLLSISLLLQNSLSSPPAQTVLISSSAQAGVGAQNAAQAAAQSSAGASVTGATAPIAPVLSSPPVSNPSFSTTPNVMMPSSPSVNSTPSEPQLRGLLRPSSTSSSTSSPIVSPSAPSSAASGYKSNIESYFQLSGSRAAQAADLRTKPTDQMNRKKFSKGRALWHILDNAGVPMFGGNNEPDVDRRITRNYVDPPLPDLNSKAGQAGKSSIATPNVRTTTSNSDTDYGIQRGPHKIPESQLEGTDIPIPDVHPTQ